MMRAKFAILALPSLCVAACSSSSSGGGGTTPEGGDDSVSYAMPESGPASEGGGGSDASDAPSCNIPAGATYSYDGGSGGFGCTPIGPDPMCDSKSYLVRCIASDPYNNPGMLPSSLSCGTGMLTSMPVETEFCCACK